MFLLYFLGCWTSIQFDFLSVLVVLFIYFLKIVVVLLLVVLGGTVSTYASILAWKSSFFVLF